MAKVVNGKKYYPVSERYFFGLQSMYEHCAYLLECEYDNLTAKEVSNIMTLQSECDELITKARRGYVDGKTIGRIKNITYQREWIRYQACLAAGMDEREAAKALNGE